MALVGLVLGTGLAVAQDQTHTVRTGDTLWGIAGQYLGDPVLWPEIYRRNTDVVEDPHWIYPGEVLRISGNTAQAPSVPTQDTPPPATDQPPVIVQQMPVVPDNAPSTVTVGRDTIVVAVGLPADTVTGVLNLSASDAAPSDMTPLFGTNQRSQQMLETLEAYTQQPYRPLRRSEFYSSGFLSEEQKLPLGNFRGPVSPSQIATSTSSASVALYSHVALTPPAGGSYQVGDSLLVVRIDRRIDHFGDVIVPTGMVRVIDVSRPENVAEIVAVYGPIRAGQQTLLVEKFNDPGHVRPVPISDGVEAAYLESRDRQVLKGPQDVIFLNKGKLDGVSPGDLFEMHRVPAARPDGSSTTPEVLGTLQVVRVGDHHATARVLNVVYPDVPPGTPARQVAKLPS
ncbi:MAG: LysM peptidoglycan-binding domain-containing protein [Gemmatimonadota bacterium]